MGLRTKVMNRLGWVRKRNIPRKLHTVQEAIARTLQGQQVTTVFDVGAYTGGVAKIYRRQFPQAKVFSFEPAPHTFATLAEACAEDPLIQPINLALSDATGTAEFQVNEAAVTNSLLGSSKEWESWVRTGAMESVQTVEVPVDTVDAFCEREGIERIDFLKVDAQGADLKVLHGARRMLTEQRIRSIFVETEIVPLYKGQGELHEIYGFMHGLGYCLFDFCDAAHAPSGQMMWCDMLFAPGKGIS